MLTLGNIGSKLITFFLVPLYTAALTTEQYGTTDLIFTLYNLLIPVVTILIYLGLMRFSLEEDADHRQLFSSSLYVTLFGLLILLICRPAFIWYDAIAPYFWFFIAYCFTNSMNTVLLYFARGIDHVKDYAIATIINTSCVVAFNIFFLLYLHLGVHGYLLAYTLSHLVASLYLIIRLKVWEYILPPTSIDRSLIIKLAIFCIPLIPNTISWWVSNQSDKFVLILFDGLALSGIYAIAYKIPSILSVVSNIFINAWQISSVDEFGSDNSKKFYSDIYEKYISVQLMMTSAVILFCRLAAKILFKNEFFEAWHYIPLLTLAVMVHAMGTFFGSVYTAAKKTKGVGISTLAAAAINVSLNFILIPRFHAYGAAFATLVSYVVIVIVRTIHSRRFFEFEINFGNDFLCYAILIGQMFVSTFDIKYRFAVNLACFAFLFVIRRKSFLDMFHMMRRLIQKKKK